MSIEEKSVPSDNPNDYCRLCFSNRNLVALFQYDEHRRQHLVEEISNCTGIQIEAVEDRPCSVCWRCAVAVEDFQLFRKRCLKNDMIIRSKYSTTTIRHGKDEWLISIPASELPPDVKEEETADAELLEPMENAEGRSERSYGKFNNKTMTELNAGDSESDTSTTCHLCKNEFGSRQSLYAHIKEQHTDRGRPHKCDLCQATFKRRSHLEDHVSSHTGEVRYPCKDCGTRFPKAKSLSRHRQQCHQKLPPTQVNPAKRQTSSTEGQFKCNFCPKSFKHRPSLNFHIKTHNELLPFLCVMCDTRFATKQGMLVHQGKYHPNPVDAFKTVPSSLLEPKKNFQCTLCTRYFEQRHYLTQHMKFMHHPNEIGDLNEQEGEDPPVAQDETEKEDNVANDTEAVTIKLEVDENVSMEGIGDS